MATKLTVSPATKLCHTTTGEIRSGGVMNYLDATLFLST
jgi:hypothetical protein